MHTEVNESGRFERTLTVTLQDDELAAAKGRAAAKLSKQIKIKGFRPGKAPLAMVERHVGADYLRTETVEEAIQNVVPEAIDEAGLDPVTVPSVSAIRDDNEDGSVEIDIVVTLWPVLDALPDFQSIEIEVEDTDVSEDEVNEQIDSLRSQFAELTAFDGELSKGDFAVIDIAVEHDGEAVESASASGLLYEIGSEAFFEGLDTLLPGASAGDTVTGEGKLPEGYSDMGGETVTMTVTITDAQKKVLPELTDDMVQEATDFDSADELVEAIETNMRAYKINAQITAFRDGVVQYVVNEVDLDLPEALLSSEVEARIRNLVARLEQSDLSVEDYLKITGQDEAGFVAVTRAEADQALSTRIVLDSISAIEGWEFTDEELLEEVKTVLEVEDEEAANALDAWKANGQVEALTGDMLRERAMASLVEAATAVDKAGNPVDLTPVEIVQPEHGQNEEEEEDSDTESVEDPPAASDDEEDTAPETEEQG